MKKCIWRSRHYLAKTTLVCIFVWIIIFATWSYFSQGLIEENQLVLVQNVEFNLGMGMQLMSSISPIRNFHIKKRLFPGDEKPIKNITMRPENCNQCFITDFPFLEEGKTCIDNKDPDVLVLVFTQLKNRERRKALRETWLTDVKRYKADYTFVVGTDDKISNSLALVENKVFKDILIIGFKDSYANLTYKTIMSFKWAEKRCPSAKYILKVDDDMWLNFGPLMTLVSRGVLRQSLGGRCNFGSQPFRDPRSKYYVPYRDYPSNIYPPFCSGTAYIADTNVIRDILSVSPNVPFFRLEDVYIALCMRRLKYHLTNIPGFHSSRIFPLPCLYKSPMIITSHQLTPSELRNIFSTSCEKQKNEFMPKYSMLLPEKMMFDQRWPKGKLARKSIFKQTPNRFKAFDRIKRDRQMRKRLQISRKK